jgi:AbrB family looped-hinge helix DNA binding protein
MEVVVSPKYQIVIPKEVREAVGVKKGDKVQVFAKDGMVTIVPEKSIRELRGILRGMSRENIREEEERV